MVILLIAAGLMVVGSYFQFIRNRTLVHLNEALKLGEVMFLRCATSIPFCIAGIGIGLVIGIDDWKPAKPLIFFSWTAAGSLLQIATQVFIIQSAKKFGLGLATYQSLNSIALSIMAGYILIEDGNIGASIFALAAIAIPIIGVKSVSGTDRITLAFYYAVIPLLLAIQATFFRNAGIEGYKQISILSGLTILTVSQLIQLVIVSSALTFSGHKVGDVILRAKNNLLAVGLPVTLASTFIFSAFTIAPVGYCRAWGLTEYIFARGDGLKAIDRSPTVIFGYIFLILAVVTSIL